jgi:hypothetical protein
MSLFAKHSTKVVEIGDVQVTVRKLSWKSLEKAKVAKSAEQAASLRPYGGEVVKALHSPELTEAAANLKKKKNDPGERLKAHYERFDRSSVLYAGIVSWSIEDKVNPEAIDDLEEAVAEELHRQIVDLSAPFKDEAPKED